MWSEEPNPKRPAPEPEPGGQRAQHAALCLLWGVLGLLACSDPPQAAVPVPDAGTATPDEGTAAEDRGVDQLTLRPLRIAQFNLREMSTAKLWAAADPQAAAAAEIAARFSPDILCFNEIQYDVKDIPEAGLPGVDGVEAQLGSANGGAQNAHRLNQLITSLPGGQAYTDALITFGNSGMPWTGFGGTGSFYLRGWGEWPGQFNTVVLSRYPILHDQVRIIHDFPWADLPENTLARMKEETGLEPPAGFPLFEKSLNVIPVQVGDTVLHLVLLHPVSPVFDPINAYRNFDALRALALFLGGALPGVDPLPADARFVVVGDLNADPEDGDSLPGAIAQILEHPAVVAHFPAGAGTRGANGQYNTYISGCGRGEASVSDPDTRFQLQLDYLLPSRTIGSPVDSLVFFPDRALAQDDFDLACKASDHRLLYIDLAL